MSNPKSRILLVDDEPFNLLLLEELLQLEGYTTLSASCGSVALETATDFQPDLILLDVMMPDLDGFEVCERLRQDPSLQTVPIIFLTALDDDESRLRGLESMGDDYLTKPINSNLLLAKITSILRLNQMRSQQIQRQVTQQTSAITQVNQQLAEKFRLFVPDQFLNRIAPKGVGSIQLGNSQEEELTILFCDIRSFTTIAETQTATETFNWLNGFFTEMEQAIAANGGFIDKFMGDAIMAIFDRPATHPQDAIVAALAMTERLEIFNGDRAQYHLEKPINIGIGIHSGKVAIGTVGSNLRMESTAIGDTVNTASRLEQLTKVYNCQIIASEAVINGLTQSAEFTYQLIDCIAPIGKQQPIKIYQILNHQTWLSCPRSNKHGLLK